MFHKPFHLRNVSSPAVNMLPCSSARFLRGTPLLRCRPSMFCVMMNLTLPTWPRPSLGSCQASLPASPESTHPGDLKSPAEEEKPVPGEGTIFGLSNGNNLRIEDKKKRDSSVIRKTAEESV